MNSGKDVPTFIPRTYLWSRRSSSPPKPPVEGTTGGNSKWGPVAGVANEISREWKQLESSRHGVTEVRERRDVTDNEILNTRLTSDNNAHIQWNL